MGKYKKETIDIVKEELKKYLDNDEKINKLCKIYYNLTDKGFEIYIAEFFRNILKYDIKIRGGFKDRGIDIEAKKDINGKEQKVFIQCKQWHWGSKKWHITKKELSSFLGNIQKEKTENTVLYLITTSRLTQEAKKFAKENDIKIKDYKDIINIYDKFTFEEFEQLIKYGKYNYKNKIFENDYGEIIKKKNIEIKKTIKTTKNNIENLKLKIDLINFIKKIKLNRKIESIILITTFILILTIIYYISININNKKNNITNNDIIQKEEYVIIKNNKKNIKK